AAGLCSPRAVRAARGGCSLPSATVSRREWRCRYPGCSVPHGAVLGRLTADGGLVLDLAVASFRCYLDTRRAVVMCPACGVEREFRGGAVSSCMR
ncbi:MAG: hypothetical protein M3R02_28560, partial [Chloroflexota bacterium]|nr:hypothetical protein [Chloroflexota bacterium]